MMYQLAERLEDEPDLFAKLNKKAVDGLRERLGRLTVEKGTTIEAEVTAEAQAEVGASVPGLFKLLSRITSRLRGGAQEKKTLRQQFDGDATLFLEDLNLLLDDLDLALRNAGRGGLVFVIDSLDRVIIRSVDDQTHRTSHTELFIENAKHLMTPNCSLVYTLPISLLSNANVSNTWGTRPFLLPMVRVRDQDGDPVEGALDAMIYAVRQRMDVDSLFEHPSDVRELCRMSGGHLRDLMLMLRDACSYTPDGKKISTSAVNTAIQNLVANYQRQIHEDEIESMIQVHRTKRLPNSPECARLPVNLLVLEYRNGSTPWNDVHPAALLTPQLKPARDGDD